MSATSTLGRSIRTRLLLLVTFVALVVGGVATMYGFITSQGVLRAVRHKREAILAGNTGNASDVELSISSSILPVAAVAVPLRHDENGLDVLYVTLTPEYGNGEWLALTALAPADLEFLRDRLKTQTAGDAASWNWQEILAIVIAIIQGVSKSH